MMMNSLFLIATIIFSVTIYLTNYNNILVFAQAAQPGQPVQPGPSHEPVQPGPSVASDHTGQNQSGQLNLAKGPLDQLGNSLGKLFGPK